VPGQLKIGEQVFQINQDFQQAAQQVADDLNLDELDAAQICLESETESHNSGRSLYLCAILRFHQRRKYMLDCLYLILLVANDVDRDGPILDGLRGVIDFVVGDDSSTNGSSKYVGKCLADMTDIREWREKIIEKLAGASRIGGRNEDLEEAAEYQRTSLTQQHESLAVVILYLVKMGKAAQADFEALLETLRNWGVYDHLMRKSICSVGIQHFTGEQIHIHLKSRGLASHVDCTSDLSV